MRKYAVPALSAAAVSFAAAHGAAAPAAWQEDLRRCMIYMPIEGGRVVIANDDGVLEIDVKPEADGAGTSEKFTVTFDARTPIDTTPPQGASGIYDHRLGTFEAIAPVFARARDMAIAIMSSNAPARSIAVPVGNGAKAMAFLKKCNDYWRRQNAKHR